MKQLLLAFIVVFGGAATATAGVDIHVNIGPAPYYGYAPYDVASVEQYVPAPYVPRVLILSRYAHVPPYRIVRHYRDGWGWDRLYNHYGVPTRVIYESAYFQGPPHGKARGYWKRNKHYRR